MAKENYNGKYITETCECQLLAEILSHTDESLKGKEEKIRDFFLMDSLTGLPNRTKLLNDIKKNSCPVLFVINIDRFSQMNNLFGIESGDFVIKVLANRLKSYFSGGAFRLYKLPADEYAVLTNLSGTGETCALIQIDQIPYQYFEGIAKKIAKAVAKEKIVLSDRKNINAYEIFPTVTIGMAVSRVVGRENLITSADIALKTAKQKRKPFMFYKQSDETMVQYENNIRWATILNDALGSDRVLPFFQPIINNKTGKADKYEALVRLIDIEGNAFPPVHFLDISKVVRLYPEITRRMVRKSFEIIKNAGCGLSLNLSIEDILDEDAMDFISDIIKSYNIGNRVSFEILESESIKNFDRVVDFIQCFKDLGCKVGIDDFGTGYCNFSYLIQMEVDFIKIDGSLIENIDKDKNAGIIVSSIMGFARDLGIKTIAEFVHSGEVQAAVHRLGIDSSQGYYLGAPAARSC